MRPLSRQKEPVTPAVRALRAAKVDFELKLYEYVDHGGTSRAAQELELPEEAVIKTLVFEDEAKRPFLVLMHGHLEVSLRETARVLGVKSVTPCTPEAAQRHTGYQVGGTSPFGTRKPLAVLAEESIFDLKRIYVNAGKRGALAALDPAVLREHLEVTLVKVGRPRR